MDEAHLYLRPHSYFSVYGPAGERGGGVRKEIGLEFNNDSKMK